MADNRCAICAAQRPVAAGFRRCSAIWFRTRQNVVAVGRVTSTVDDFPVPLELSHSIVIGRYLPLAIAFSKVAWVPDYTGNRHDALLAHTGKQPADLERGLNKAGAGSWSVAFPEIEIGDHVLECCSRYRPAGRHLLRPKAPVANEHKHCGHCLASTATVAKAREPITQSNRVPSCVAEEQPSL